VIRDRGPYCGFLANTLHHRKSGIFSSVSSQLCPPRAFIMSTTLGLNCWVFGESSKRIFSVKILKTKTVGALKGAIKDEKQAFKNIDADSLNLRQVSEPYCWLHLIAYLDLWKVSIPDDHNLKQKLQTLVLGDELSLSSMARLSTVFLDVPKKGHCLHIVVKTLPGGEC